LICRAPRSRLRISCSATELHRRRSFTLTYLALMSEPRPAVAVVLPLALVAYACVALGVAHWWVSGLVAPVVAALLWRRHPRARFAAYVFLSLVALRGALAHRWAALAFAVVVVALMQTAASRRAWPRLRPGAARAAEFC